MGNFLSKLKDILRRRRKNPAHSLSAEWVIQQLKNPREIIPLYDSADLSVEQVRRVENYRCWKPSQQAVFIQCTKLAGRIDQQDLITKAIELCCEEACFRATGIRVKFMVRSY